jgi:uncharacterized membrane protein
MRFAHFMGISVWIGGALAALIIAAALRDADSPSQSFARFALSRIHGWLIAPGAVVSVLSGALLTMSLTQRGMSSVIARPGMMVMLAAGVLAAVLAVFVSVPTANQLAILYSRPEGGASLLAKRLHKRQAVVSTLAGVLVLVAMYFGVVVR